MAVEAEGYARDVHATVSTCGDLSIASFGLTTITGRRLATSPRRGRQLSNQKMSPWRMRAPFAQADLRWRAPPKVGLPVRRMQFFFASSRSCS